MKSWNVENEETVNIIPYQALKVVAASAPVNQNKVSAGSDEDKKLVKMFKCDFDVDYQNVPNFKNLDEYSDWPELKCTNFHFSENASATRLFKVVMYAEEYCNTRKRSYYRPTSQYKELIYSCFEFDPSTNELKPNSLVKKNFSARAYARK